MLPMEYEYIMHSQSLVLSFPLMMTVDMNYRSLTW